MADYIQGIYSDLGGQGKVPPSSAKFLQAWQRKEGGATNNSATYNWLNRTDKGYPTINSVGVVAYPNANVGMQRTADLIRSGYPALSKAIVTGAVNLSNPSQQGDLNRWVSGQRTPGASKYVASIASFMGQSAGAAPASSGGGMPAAPAMQQQALPTHRDAGQLAATMMAGLRQSREARNSGGAGGVLPLIGRMLQLRAAQAPVAPALAQAPDPTQVPAGPQGPGGKMVVTSQGWKGTHITDGLDWNHGQKTAGDIMATAGSPVGAPEAGTVVRHGSAQGGSSLYFKGVSGKMYWMGHIENALPVGTQVNVNQPIAVISSHHPRPHLHIDELGGQ
jgi:hypothetical protein